MLNSQYGSVGGRRATVPVLARRACLAPVALAAVVSLTACAPTIQLAADKPITINLNVKIDQEVRYRIDKDLEDAIAANPDLF